MTLLETLANQRRAEIEADEGRALETKTGARCAFCEECVPWRLTRALKSGAVICSSCARLNSKALSDDF